MLNENADRICLACGNPSRADARYCCYCSHDHTRDGVGTGLRRIFVSNPLAHTALIAVIAGGIGAGAAVVAIDRQVVTTADSEIPVAVLKTSDGDAVPLIAPRPAASRGCRRATNPGNRHEAAAYLDGLTKKSTAAPDDVRAWKDLARERYSAAIVDRTNLPAAGYALDHALALEPNDAELVRMRAGVSYDQAKYGEAREFLERYLALEPDDNDARLNLASALVFQGDRAAAKQIYRSLIEDDERSGKAHLYLGMALFADDDVEGAIAAFENAKLLAHSPEEREQAKGLLVRAQAKNMR